MFQFRRFPPYNYVFIIRSIPLPVLRFPHSEIHGSQPIRGSPWLIAAYHVLLRLPVTRHSPCALLSLTFHICSASFWQTPQKKIFDLFLFRGAELRSVRSLCFLLSSFSSLDVQKYAYRSKTTILCSKISQKIRPKAINTALILCPNYSYSLDCFTWIIWVFSVIVVTEISFSYLLYFIT